MEISHDPSPEIEQLKKAVEGLTYPSESDEPFDVFFWDAKGSASAKDQVVVHAGKGRGIEEVPVEKFFADLKDSEDADRFEKLRHVLESQLAGLKVFRVGTGEVRVDVYLIGKTRSGEWAGLHTVSVET
jgi:hypothetical protein